jgi:2-polyprenyl-6-methoxyphenol hydroxylase-like FAD-dependent oxidoreductase
MRNTNNRRNRSDCQVLIVGAGPTGLVLAAELLARGVGTRIIDQGDGAALQTRALGVHARTLEVFELMGLADRFLALGHEVHRFRMYTAGKPLVNLDLSLSGSRFGFMLDIPQNETERLLRDRVRELGGSVEQGRELIRFRDVDGRVTASVKDASGAVDAITADYLVGCDGAHSRVRHELGLEFQGRRYSGDWLLADVRLDWDRPEDEVHAFFRRDGLPLICFPMRDHVWRVVLPYAGDRGRQAPTLPEIQDLVDQRAPQPVGVSDPTWLASFRCQLRSTHVYRQGRVFLAGDAVHVHSPAGGQGMNTGIMDAHNLAWKLALVASGSSRDWLLGTYGEERAPVAAEVLGLTDALVKLGTMTHPVKRALRDTFIPLASRIPAIQRRAVRRMTHHHVTYRSSRLTQPGASWAGLTPGDRIGDVDVVCTAGRSRLYKVLARGRHVLFASDALTLNTLNGGDIAAYTDVFETVVADPPAAQGHRRSSRAAVLLIRPDGYIAARGSLDRVSALMAYLHQVFGARAAHLPDARPGNPRLEAPAAALFVP